MPAAPSSSAAASESAQGDGVGEGLRAPWPGAAPPDPAAAAGRDAAAGLAGLAGGVAGRGADLAWPAGGSPGGDGRPALTGPRAGPRPPAGGGGAPARGWRGGGGGGGVRRGGAAPTGGGGAGAQPLEELRDRLLAGIDAEHRDHDWRAVTVGDLDVFSIDGSLTRVPDTPANRQAFGSAG